MSKPRLVILGIRGVPAAHGGFETFGEALALYLVQRGWDVTVYCQASGDGLVHEDEWHGLRRVFVPVSGTGALSTVAFDWKSVGLAARQHGALALTLGYNTAIFCARLRLAKVPNIINMDGLEWQRVKWGPLPKLWLWVNERAGCWLGNHLVADHPEIQRHLATRIDASKITVIPYGAEQLTLVDESPLLALGLQPGCYLTVIARPEPENSVLEIVQAFSARPRGQMLVVLGKFASSGNAYHERVRQAASAEVKFVGAIYDPRVVQALRKHCTAYVHGHRVGGTNPSLVEALGAGNAVFAHNNRFNRWVAGEGAAYFDGLEPLQQLFDELLQSPARLAAMRQASVERFAQGLTWPHVLAQYETLLRSWRPAVTS